MWDPLAVAVRVFVAWVGPKVQLSTVAIPFASVTTGVAGSTVPPPLVAGKVTGRPAPGVPLASSSTTEGGAATAVLNGALCVITECAAIVDPRPVASNRTGLPVMPDPVAVAL